MSDSNISRRRFIKNSSAVAGGSIAFNLICIPHKSWAVPVATYKVGTVKNPSKVKGTVKYDGRKPGSLKSPITRDNKIAGTGMREFEGVTYADEKKKTLKDAIVTIEGIAVGKPWNAKEVPMVYTQKAYILDRTDVFGWAKRGRTTLKLENRDPILHSWVLKLGVGKKGKQVANKAAPPNSKTSTRIKKPGIYELLCSPHPWERGFRVVVPHPYYAKTNEKGEFEIDNVPAGTYEVTVWSEGFEVMKEKLTVKKGATKYEPVLKESNLNEMLKYFLPKPKKKNDKSS